MSKDSIKPSKTPRQVEAETDQKRQLVVSTLANHAEVETSDWRIHESSILSEILYLEETYGFDLDSFLRTEYFLEQEQIPREEVRDFLHSFIPFGYQHPVDDIDFESDQRSFSPIAIEDWEAMLDFAINGNNWHSTIINNQHEMLIIENEDSWLAKKLSLAPRQFIDEVIRRVRRTHSLREVLTNHISSYDDSNWEIICQEATDFFDNGVITEDFQNIEDIQKYWFDWAIGELNSPKGTTCHLQDEVLDEFQAEGLKMGYSLHCLQQYPSGFPKGEKSFPRVFIHRSDDEGNFTFDEMKHFIEGLPTELDRRVATFLLEANENEDFTSGKTESEAFAEGKTTYNSSTRSCYNFDGVNALCRELDSPYLNDTFGEELFAIFRDYVSKADDDLLSILAEGNDWWGYSEQLLDKKFGGHPDWVSYTEFGFVLVLSEKAKVPKKILRHYRRIANKAHQCYTDGDY
tara:strand:+ start:138 stop:1520 length:1383 start_codon:yes stop_codon:yes gene_type:complete